ncbi:hypothetical protein [Brasilonema sp. UFV-L1]|uniref:hypothetical protein n=1 Tax=Brasilonema sp. UFV-L1 TaxID=2234130 RepID=UPI00145D142E|nr:hypothetical protein [Brasilonema sp. UFV-L1]NMG09744.1 hypothetical protein [Brasilonema sp. UFV-L1]
MSQPKIQLTLTQREVFPSGIKLFYKEFDPALIKKACLQYLAIHNFNWSNWGYAKLKFSPTSARDFLLSDHPMDMSDALSVDAFTEFYQSIENLDDDECTTRIRTYCIVVCSLAKGMFYVKQWFRGKWNSTDSLMDLTIQIAFDN